MKLRRRVLHSLVILLSCAVTLWAQAAPNGQTLFGDIHVAESNDAELKNPTLMVILYSEGGVMLQRQTVSNNGRYRFNNLPAAVYVVVLESEGKEVSRMRVDMRSPLLGDLRQDIELEWKANGPVSKRASTISAADLYSRTTANQALFNRAQDQLDKKHYNQAAETLSELVKTDPKDFQAWTELANVHFMMKIYSDAETEYFRAIDLHPNFFLGLMNLGRLEVAQQKYEMAIDILNRAKQLRADSADVNYFLGEAYLQIKKGSMAVPFLNEALKLDPVGMAEVHLRLATLYHHAGLTDKAALEYEAYLKKKPDYPERKKLQEYIQTHKAKTNAP